MHPDTPASVDDRCLCGRRHPCDLHGAWTGTPYRADPVVEPDGATILHLMHVA